MKWFKKEKTELEKEMDSVTERLTNIDPGSEEYGIVADNLGKLQKIKTMDDEQRKAVFEIIKIGGSVLGSVITMVFISNQNKAIMDFERDGTLRSSAWKFNPKFPFGKNNTVNM